MVLTAGRFAPALEKFKHDPKLTNNPWVKEHQPGTYMVMGETAEVVAKRYKISREAQDQWYLFLFGRKSRCPRCGSFRVEKLRGENHDEEDLEALLNEVELLSAEDTQKHLLDEGGLEQRN